MILNHLYFFREIGQWFDPVIWFSLFHRKIPQKGISIFVLSISSFEWEVPLSPHDLVFCSLHHWRVLPYQVCWWVTVIPNPGGDDYASSCYVCQQHYWELIILFFEIFPSLCFYELPPLSFLSILLCHPFSISVHSSPTFWSPVFRPFLLSRLFPHSLYYFSQFQGFIWTLTTLKFISTTHTLVLKSFLHIQLPTQHIPLRCKVVISDLTCLRQNSGFLSTQSAPPTGLS